MNYNNEELNTALTDLASTKVFCGSLIEKARQKTISKTQLVETIDSLIYIEAGGGKRTDVLKFLDDLIGSLGSTVSIAEEHSRDALVPINYPHVGWIIKPNTK